MRNFLLTLLLGSSFLFLSAQSTLTPEMIADIVYIREPVLSPDGQTIAYSKRIPQGETDKPGQAFFEIHTLGVDGSGARAYITQPRSAYDLSWSPNGKFIYFRTRRKTHDLFTQVYRIPVDGGEAEMVTGHETTVQDYALSPNGQYLAYTARDPKTREEKLAVSNGEDWIEVGKNPKFTRLFVIELPDGSPRRVFEADLDVTDFTWTPNNINLVFRAAEVPETDSRYMYQDIYQVNASGGRPAKVVNTQGKLGDMAVSPDGSYLAYLGAVDLHDPIAQSLFVVPMSGGTPRNVSEGLRASGESVAWKDATTLLLSCAEGVYTSLYELDLEKDQRKKVYGDGLIFSGFDVHAKTNTVVFPAHAPAHPRELFVANLKNLKPRRLTISNPELEQVSLATQEVMRWNGPDGVGMEGILTYPLGYQEGKSYPLILQLHGGPEGVSQHGFNTRAVYPVQLYAGAGFFVLEPNYRGSKGRGVEFAKADQGDLGGKEFEDVLLGVDALVAEGKVNPDKVASGGFSYGGYLSAWAATKHSQRFQAAVMGAGISNWISFTGTSDIPLENSLVHWNLWWYDDDELVWDRSPLAHLQAANTPVLVVHGEKDLRVPLGQGTEMYQALKLRNIPTEMVIYPRQGHGIRERAAQLDYMRRTLRWYEKYLR